MAGGADRVPPCDALLFFHLFVRYPAFIQVSFSVQDQNRNR